MGAENAISALIDSMLDTLLPEPQPGEEVDPDQQSYAQQIKSFVRKGLESLFGFADGAVNMSSVTHNRVYLSPDKPFLTFETLIPYMEDSTAGLNITFTPAHLSGGTIGSAPCRGIWGQDVLNTGGGV